MIYEQHEGSLVLPTPWITQKGFDQKNPCQLNRREPRFSVGVRLDWPCPPPTTNASHGLPRLGVKPQKVEPPSRSIGVASSRLKPTFGVATRPVTRELWFSAARHTLFRKPIVTVASTASPPPINLGAQRPLVRHVFATPSLTSPPLFTLTVASRST